VLRCDNGPELACAAMAEWAHGHVGLHFRCHLYSPMRLSCRRGIFVLIGSIIAVIVCAAIAGMKGRNPLGWGIFGLFFSIITLIVVIVIPSKKS